MAAVVEPWTAGKMHIEMPQGGALLLDGPDTQSGRGTKGVRFVLSKLALDAWVQGGCIKFVSKSKRPMGISCKYNDARGKSVCVFHIVTYTPVGNAIDTEWEEYLAELDGTIAKKQQGGYPSYCR